MNKVEQDVCSNNLRQESLSKSSRIQQKLQHHTLGLRLGQLSKICEMNKWNRSTFYLLGFCCGKEGGWRAVGAHRTYVVSCYAVQYKKLMRKIKIMLSA